jgi:hypothetical protein
MREGFFLEVCKGKCNLNLGIDEIIILKWILKHMRARIGLNCLRIL